MPSDEVALPPAATNLFGRIIRNPVPHGRPPRERECAEMLCALLQNTTALRDAVLDALAELVVESPDWPSLTLELSTEGAVTGGKRDDLRIEARDEDGRRVLLWSVEVKVAAGFHVSADLDDPDQDVHQLVHYDRWLCSQSDVQHRAGFVLGVRDMTSQLDGVREQLDLDWPCMTWWTLRGVVEDVLGQGDLPVVDAFLGEHFAGFVRQHLSGGEHMEDTDISFDDIALLRAIAVLGEGLNTKVDALVEPIGGILERQGLGVGEAKPQPKILGSHFRSVVWRYLVEGENNPYIMAGVVTERGVDLALWIECSRSSPHKAAVSSVCQEVLPELQALNKRWTIDPTSARWDLELRRPLRSILDAADQRMAVLGFAEAAIRDLVAVRLQERLAEALGRSAP